MAAPIFPEPLSGEPTPLPDSALSMTALTAALPSFSTPAPKPTATLEGMPAEIMSMILNLTHEPEHRYYDTPAIVYTVGPSQLFALRLSSRRLESTTFDAFVRRFFKARKHVLGQSSMQRLADVIADSRFGPHIKEMAFVPECERCSGFKHRCGDCSKSRRRKWVNNWPRMYLVQPVTMDPALWLETCSRVQVLTFNKTWPGPFCQVGQFEIHWIKDILMNCHNLTDLTLINEISADAILYKVQCNSLRRLTLANGCRIFYSNLALFLKQHTDTLEVIKIARIHLECGNCEIKAGDGSTRPFLSWVSMFEFMLEMPRLKTVQFDKLMQRYHHYHERHLRLNSRNVHPSATTEHSCFVASGGDVTTRLQLAIDRLYTVGIPVGSTTSSGNRALQVVFP